MELVAYNKLFEDVCTKFMVIVVQVEENAEQLRAAQHWWAMATQTQQRSPEGAIKWKEIQDFTQYKDAARGPGFEAFKEVWLQYFEPYQKGVRVLRRGNRMAL